MAFSLVIPFYNEEKNISGVVSGLVSNFERVSTDYELILVDNGSVDKSPQILENLANENRDRIKVVHVPVNQGYGWGVINGLKQASGEIVGYMWGDGQIKPEDVIRVFNHLNDGDCDLVKAKRVVRRDGVIRRILSVAYNLLFLIMFSMTTMDINGSPKIFKGELLETLHPESKDWFIDGEILIKARYLKLKVGEIPVEFLHREQGKSHVRFNTIFEFARNMLNYRFGRGIKQWKQEISRS